MEFTDIFENFKSSCSDIIEISENLIKETKKNDINKKEVIYLLNELRDKSKNFTSNYIKLGNNAPTDSTEPIFKNLFEQILFNKKLEDSQFLIDGKINKILFLLGNKYASQEIIINRIMELSVSLKNKCKNIQQYFNQKNPLLFFSELVQLFEFTNLNYNWVIASSYLAALDIAVYKKRKELGLKTKSEEKGNWPKFEDRFNQLIEYIRNNNRKEDLILQPLTVAFWKMRIKIIHFGYCPTKEELDLITKNSLDLIEKINKIN